MLLLLMMMMMMMMRSHESRIKSCVEKSHDYSRDSFCSRRSAREEDLEEREEVAEAKRS